jgi:aryl sulfotransferase
MARIFWLASYPKSGNTWLRLLLANYQNADAAPADINTLGYGGAFSRLVFDEYTGLEASCLGAKIAERLRPDVYRAMAAEAAEHAFVKLHDAWRRSDRGEPVFPADATHGVVYILRNVLDLASSCAHHWGCDLETAVKNLSNPEFMIAASDRMLNLFLPQPLGSWSTHIASWLDESGLPVHLVRYEDLQADTAGCFAQILAFCGLERDEERLRRAVAYSSFAALQAQEQEKGFREHSQFARGNFFRSGQVGSWREELSPDLVRRLVDAHGDMMRRFSYLDEQGNPKEQGS